jgi:hypothetical protein
MGEVLLSLDFSWYSKLRQIRDLPEKNVDAMLDILYDRDPTYTKPKCIPLGVFSNRELCWNYICHYLETSKIGQFFKRMLDNPILKLTAGMKLEDQYVMRITYMIGQSSDINISFKDLREALAARSAAEVTWKPSKTPGTIYYIHRNSDGIFTFSESPSLLFGLLLNYGRRHTGYVAYLDHGCSSRNVNQCPEISYEEIRNVINGYNKKEAGEIVSDILGVNDLGPMVAGYLKDQDLANVVATVPKGRTARRKPKPT